MKELRAALLIVVAMVSFMYAQLLLCIIRTIYGIVGSEHAWHCIACQCLQLHCVLGDYELQVQFHRYVNPTSRCQGCHTPGAVTCCDGNNLGTCTGHELCDNIFLHCLRMAPNTECLQEFSRNATFVDADDIISLVPLRFTVPGAWEVSAQVHSLAVVKIYVCFRGSSSLLVYGMTMVVLVAVVQMNW